MRRWQTIRSSILERHAHHHAYAAVVLSGGYEEAGDCGRFRVEAGDVLLHDRFETHLNRFSDSGATVLNLALPVELDFVPGRARLEDPSVVVCASEVSSVEAVGLLVSLMCAARPEPPADWPEVLAGDMVRNPCLNLSRWSELHGLTPWSVSRGFSQVFGISPRAFRARTRARQAWKAIERDNKTLSATSGDLGFADQPHMSRNVKMLTGRSPGALRSVAVANRFKTH